MKEVCNYNQLIFAYSHLQLHLNSKAFLKILILNHMKDALSMSSILSDYEK